jgi:hypothetical protein
MTEHKVDAKALAAAQGELADAKERLKALEKDNKDPVAIAKAEHEKAKCEANLAKAEFGPTSKQYQQALDAVDPALALYKKAVADAAGTRCFKRSCQRANPALPQEPGASTSGTRRLVRRVRCNCFDSLTGVCWCCFSALRHFESNPVHLRH